MNVSTENDTHENEAQPPTREDAYRRLFADVYDDAVRFAIRRAPDLDADEAVSTAMLTAWRRLDDAPADLDGRRAWVFGIVRKTLLNDRRARGRRDALAVRVATDAELGVASSGGLAVTELRLDVVRAWRSLSDAQQEVLALAVFEQLDHARAATVLGIREGAYRVRLTRARWALRVTHGGAPESEPSLLADLSTALTPSVRKEV